MPGFAAKAAATRQLRGESPALQLELFDFDGMTGTDNRKTQVLKTEPAAPADSTQDDNMWTSDQAKMGTICRAPTRKMPEDMRRPDLDVPECCGLSGKTAGEEVNVISRAWRAGAFITLVLVVTMLASGVSAQQGVVKVGTASASAGEKASGVIDVPAGVDAGTKIPVVVLHGAKAGPTLALVTGAHGTEYVSIIAVEKLIQQLDPGQVSGTVILLPLVNIASFEQKVPHVNPVDQKSMNRFYPGKADGTQTERALYLITKEVVDHCDYLIDYHGGDLDESLRPYAYWGPTGRAEQDRISKDMVLAFGLDHIIIWKERPTDPAATRYLDNTAAVRGKASIVVEAGHAGTVETDDVALLVNGTLSTMRALKMLPGEPHRVENPVWIGKLVDLIADQPGIFYPLVKRGTYAAAGMKIGYVTDYVGNVIQEWKAPEAGVVLHVNAVPSLKKGDNILDLGVVTTAP